MKDTESAGGQTAATVAAHPLGPTDCPALKILSTNKTPSLATPGSRLFPSGFTSAKDGWPCLSPYRQNISVPALFPQDWRVRFSLYQAQPVPEFPSASCVHICVHRTDLPVYVHVPPFVYGEGAGPGVQRFQAVSQLRVLEELLRKPLLSPAWPEGLWKNLVDLTVNCLKHPVKDNVMKTHKVLVFCRWENDSHWRWKCIFLSSVGTHITAWQFKDLVLTPHHFGLQSANSFTGEDAACSKKRTRSGSHYSAQYPEEEVFLHSIARVCSKGMTPYPLGTMCFLCPELISRVPGYVNPHAQYIISKAVRKAYKGRYVLFGRVCRLWSYFHLDFNTNPRSQQGEREKLHVIISVSFL